MTIKRLRFIAIVLSFLFIISALAEVALSHKLIPLLPEKIARVQINKSSKLDVEKIMGKPDLIENNKYYYEVDGLKYGLELSFEQDKLRELHFTFVKNKPAIEKLKFKFDTAELVPFPRSGASSGRYFLLSKPDAEMVIDPISHTIYSIRIRK